MIGYKITCIRTCTDNIMSYATNILNNQTKITIADLSKLID